MVSTSRGKSLTHVPRIGMSDDPSLSASAFVDEENTVFMIEGLGEKDVEALLHTVDPPAEGTQTDGRINLYFQVPVDSALEEGSYRVKHPHLPAFEAWFEQVQAGGATPDQNGYRAVLHT